MERPGFSFLISADSALLKMGLEKLIAAAGRSTQWKRAIFLGDEEPDAKFWNTLGQIGLFLEQTIVIVRHAEGWNAAIWKQLDERLSRRLDHVWPFFCIESEWDKGKPKIPAFIQKSRCYTFAEKKGWNWSSPGLADNAMQGFIKSKARELGLSFAQGSLEALSSIVMPDANAIANELAKLSLICKDGVIQPEDLGNAPQIQENDAFRLIRKLMSGDLPGCWKDMADKNDESLLFFVLALLAREFRILWQIAAGENPRLYPAEAQAKRSLAKKLGSAGLSKCFSLLAQAEWDVKSGQASPTQILESLLAKLSRQIMAR